MKYQLLLGIEHLMTGAHLSPKDQQVIPHYQFECESPSVVRVISNVPFYSEHQGRILESLETDQKPLKFSAGEVEWWAQVVAPAMNRCRQVLHDALTYARKMETYRKSDGTKYTSKTVPGEPTSFPEPVIKAFLNKYGKDAAVKLSQLQWAGDHWYYIENRMYHGVEPDGYIHT